MESVSPNLCLVLHAAFHSSLTMCVSFLFKRKIRTSAKLQQSCLVNARTAGGEEPSPQPGQLLTLDMGSWKEKVQLNLRPGGGAAYKTWEGGVVRTGPQGGGLCERAFEVGGKGGRGGGGSGGGLSSGSGLF